MNSQISIRERMDWRAERHDSAHYIQGTKGARASEYYSMAKLLPSPSQRAHYLQLAERDLEDALHSIEDEPSGYLAIRGHVRLLMGDARKALADFEEVRRLRVVGGDLKSLGQFLRVTSDLHPRAWPDLDVGGHPSARRRREPGGRRQSNFRHPGQEAPGAGSPFVGASHELFAS